MLQPAQARNAKESTRAKAPRGTFSMSENNLNAVTPLRPVTNPPVDERLASLIEVLQDHLKLVRRRTPLARAGLGFGRWLSYWHAMVVYSRRHCCAHR